MVEDPDISAEPRTETIGLVEYDRATGTSVAARVRELIASDGPVAVTEPIVMEVLARARDDAREADLRRLLKRFILLRFDSAIDFEGAVGVYRHCRVGGITPWGLIACMIAAVAIRTGAHLLAHDRDLAAIADVMSMRLDEASLPPTP